MSKGNKDLVVSEGKLERLPRAAPLVLDPMDRMLDDLFGRQSMRPAGWKHPFAALPPLAPSMDVIERHDEVIVRAAVPGVKKEDLEVSVSGTLLTIRVETREEKKEEDGEYYRCELPHGSFSRALALPAEVDESKAKATMKDGMLELKLPKLEKGKRRTIRIARA